jgi:hypothetical protein
MAEIKEEKVEEKKPFYKKIWFLFLVIIYKKIWFWVFVIIVVIFANTIKNNDSDKSIDSTPIVSPSNFNSEELSPNVTSPSASVSPSLSEDNIPTATSLNSNFEELSPNISLPSASVSPSLSDTKTSVSSNNQKNNVPIEYKNALIKAELYGRKMNMSKQGIYDQLVSEYGENFSREAAQYAIDNLKIDYNQNALIKAKRYQEIMAMSPQAIHDQLTSSAGEQFTKEEADYAIQNLNK